MVFFLFENYSFASMPEKWGVMFYTQAENVVSHVKRLEEREIFMGKQLFAAETCGCVLKTYQPLKLLVLETSPFHFQLEVLLKQYSDHLDIKRVLIRDVSELLQLDWRQYQLILLDISLERFFIDSFWLASIKQPHDIFPLYIVFARQSGGDSRVITESADSIVSFDHSGDCVTQLDSALELAGLLREYPLKLADWQLCELLHESEHALVFLARHQERPACAIKRFKFDVSHVGEAVVHNFLANAQAAKSLYSENLVQVLDAGINHQSAYLVMEYLRGESLSRRLSDDQWISLEQRLEWFRQVVQALQCLHDGGLLHRDLKSSNILIRENCQAVLLDLGLETQLLLESGFLGAREIYCTPFYVSPECIVGEPATIQSDLYALGVLFYELLTGDKPISAGKLSDILHAHLLAPVPDLPHELHHFQPLLKSLMAKLPENRPECAGEVLLRLQREM